MEVNSLVIYLLTIIIILVINQQIIIVLIDKIVLDWKIIIIIKLIPI